MTGLERKANSDLWDSIDRKTSTGAKIGVPLADRCRVLLAEQDSVERFAARCGILTGSQAGLMVTPTGKPCKSAARTSYKHALVAERLTGTAEHHAGTMAMERGMNLEPRARQWYELTTGRDVVQVGFVWHDDQRQWGCSPDGLTSDGRLVEIKCLMRKAHIACCLDGCVPTDYVPQVQFGLWVTGLPACDFVAYTPEPELPRIIIEVKPDAALHAAYAEAAPAFYDEVSALAERLRGMV